MAKDLFLVAMVLHEPLELEEEVVRRLLSFTVGLRDTFIPMSLVELVIPDNAPNERGSVAMNDGATINCLCFFKAESCPGNMRSICLVMIIIAHTRAIW